LSDNLPEVEESLKRWNTLFDRKLAEVVSDVSMRLEQLGKEEIQGERGYHYPNGKKRGLKKDRIYDKAESGKPPMNRTGDLRRSIAGTMSRKGFGSYSAEVGAYTKYARHVELGGPKWKPGVRFPYLEPAVKKLVQSNYISTAFRKQFRS